MPLLDHGNNRQIINSFHFSGTSTNIGDIVDTKNYIAILFVANYLQSGSEISSFELSDADDPGDPFVPIDTNLITRGSYSDFLLAQGATVPVLDVDLPVIGWFGTKRYVSMDWITSNVGDVEILGTLLGEVMVKPYAPS